MKEQLDLEAEARHLQRFNRNFRRWHNLSFPKPIFPHVRSEVLVETFEEVRKCHIWTLDLDGLSICDHLRNVLANDGHLKLDGGRSFSNSKANFLWMLLGLNPILPS